MSDQSVHGNPPSPTASSSPNPSNPNPPSSASPSKIACRPSKIRKISPTNKSLIVCTHPSRPLSADGELDAALRHLRASEPAFGPLIDAHEPPTCQNVHPPFHSLARSILYQQLAFKAASSIYSRFISLCGGEDSVVPEVVLALNPHQLRQIGVSERKASYLYDLARKYRSGILSDASIVAMDDKSLFTMLTMVKGIGAWSVHMFMIFSLHRPDVLPVGDLGVRKGVQLLYGLETLPKPSHMEHLCEKWRPYRSLGAWYMWRLVECKGTPTMASSAAVGLLPDQHLMASHQLQLAPAPSPQQQNQQQPQQQQQQQQQSTVGQPVQQIL